jgi:hypothetical protein
MSRSSMNTSRVGIVLLSGLMLVGCDAATTEEPNEPNDPIFDSMGRQLASITAAIARSNAQTDLDFGLVARVEIQRNEIVEFYEPAPGVIVLSGAGAPDGRLAVDGMGLETTETTRMDLRRVWGAASGGAIMPARLEAAIARWEARMPQRPQGRTDNDDLQSPAASRQVSPQEIAPVPGEAVVSSALHGTGWCNTTYETLDVFASNGRTWSEVGNCDGIHVRDATEKHCWNHQTGTVYAQRSDLWHMKSNVCPYQGEVLFRLDSDEFSTGSWTVPQHTLRWSMRTDSLCGHLFDDCPWVKTTVSQASGDLFHYRYFAWD